MRLILGIEADTPEDSDLFWRMGYTYSVQLTQWALAGATNQSVLSQVLLDFQEQMKVITTRPDEDVVDAVFEENALRNLDPLEITGPVAITKATKDYMARVNALRWQALSGVGDGGRGKVVSDTLILPITGFRYETLPLLTTRVIKGHHKIAKKTQSPGRGRYGNMGSKPYSDPDARLRHNSQGSWREVDFTVEVGKLCRTLFGGCRSWSKVSQ